jgi:stage II sporulation protein D
MKLVCKILSQKALPLVFATFFSSVFCSDFKIKVLLKKFPISSNKILNITAKKDLLVKSSIPKIFSIKNRKIQILIRENKLYGRSKKGPFRKIKHDELHIKSISEFVTINDTQYYGALSLKFVEKENSLLLINTLNLEDYVYSVLRAESYQNWPHEMQKVQAIVSRTYAVHRMVERRKKNGKKQIYDIKCNTFHQRYPGNHQYLHLRNAVDDTKNLILTYNNEVALTMFDACCGGSTPSLMEGLDFKKAPYLARKTPCNFCKKYSLYRWKRIIPIKQFLNYLYGYSPLNKKLSRERTFLSVKIKKTDKSGIVHKIKLRQNKRQRTILCGKDLWMSMSHLIRSQNFSIEQTEKNIIINGKGFGHQIGLCQRGARELVRKGWPVEKILEFYYPATKLAKLTSRSNDAIV